MDTTKIIAVLFDFDGVIMDPVYCLLGRARA